MIYFRFYQWKCCTAWLRTKRRVARLCYELPLLSGGFAMNQVFRKFSIAAANALGSSWMFIANVLLILVWLVAGPFFHYSDTWQLVVNTATTVFTYLAVFLIQNTQNRDAVATHLKLDELIKGVEGARTGLVNLEKLSDEELQALQEEFDKLRAEHAKGAAEGVSASAA
jgi:low affinity Fe/Cu permease